MFLSETPTSIEPRINNLDSGLNDFSDMANNLLKENLSINQFKVFYEPFPENIPIRNVIKPANALSNKHSNFHYINLRGKFPYEKQWHNEIHLKGAGYKTVADLYHKEIIKILGKDPLK